MPDHHRFVRKFVNAKLPIMSSRLTLISHAATSAVRTAAFPLDESIDEVGRRDAQALVASLPPFATEWTSLSKRTIETAAALNLEAKIDASLRDIDVGRWGGLTFLEVEKREPKEIEQWLSDPTSAPHGGESVAQVIQRVSEWLITVRQLRGRIAAVSHPAVVRAAIVAAIEANPGSFWRIDVGPLSVVELRSNGERWALRSIKNLA